jgi:hypothetical protein
VEPPRELEPLLEHARRLGAVEVRAVPRPGPCRVWALSGATRLWLKRYPSARSFAQERDALVGWGLRGVPQVLAEAPSALLLSDVPGGEVDDLAGWRAAGAFADAMHRGSGPDPDPMPLPEALARRWEAWSAQAAPHVDASTLRDARARFEPSAFSGDPRVRCHRDFHPRNWRWGPAGLGVIDFEHARFDHPLMDAVKVLDAVEVDDPRWRAFADGWPGLRADDPRLRSLRALHGLASVAWDAQRPPFPGSVGGE